MSGYRYSKCESAPGCTQFLQGRGTERQREKEGELNLLNKLNKKLRKDLNGAHMNVVKRGVGSARAVDFVTQIYTVPLEPKIINKQVFNAFQFYPENKTLIFFDFPQLKIPCYAHELYLYLYLHFYSHSAQFKFKAFCLHQ